MCMLSPRLSSLLCCIAEQVPPHVCLLRANCGVTAAPLRSHCLYDADPAPFDSLHTTHETIGGGSTPTAGHEAMGEHNETACLVVFIWRVDCHARLSTRYM
ncbi:hypothetical protein BDZ97DRAFT_1890470 [Flammula alnicola]|nr:hypothetical protein BDZ97DRAFT_1890470 [Flammula alnicola]